MTDPDQWWAEPSLDIDQQTERGGPLTADQEIRVLARANRLAIRCDAAARHRGDAPRHRRDRLPACTASLTPTPSAGSAGSG